MEKPNSHQKALLQGIGLGVVLTISAMFLLKQFKAK